MKRATKSGIHRSGSLTVEGAVEERKPLLLSPLDISLTLAQCDSKSTVVRLCVLLGAGVVKSSSQSEGSPVSYESATLEGFKKIR